MESRVKSQAICAYYPILALVLLVQERYSTSQLLIETGYSGMKWGAHRMQKHSGRRYRSVKQRDHPPQKKSFFKSLYDAFCQLSEPAQAILIIGLLLLLGWLLANPFILVNLVKVMLGFITIRATLKEL
jgi:hypothetical protein